MKGNTDLRRLRKEIRDTTLEIFDLIAKRMKIGEEIGGIKGSLGLPLLDEKVENELRNTVMQYCVSKGIDKELGTRILTLLFKGTIAREAGRSNSQVVSASKMFARAKELEKQGKKIIHLEVGEPDYAPPRKVLEETKDALYNGFTRYTISSGIPELKARIASHVSKKYNVRFVEKNVICTVGARFGIFAAMNAVLSAGDEVINIEPNWPAYRDTAEFLGARVRTISTTLEKSWEPSLEEIQNSISDATKMLILSYPNNPTGKVLNPKTLEKIVQIARKKNITILSDEVYADYCFVPNKSLIEFEYPNCVVVSSFSKTYAMTGFRLGYAMGNEKILAKMAKIQEIAVLSLPHFIQVGAMKAFDDETYVRRNVAEMKERFKVATKLLTRLPLKFQKPDGGLYVFPKARDANFNANRFVTELLDKKGVAVTPGTGFGNYPHFFRISLNQPANVLIEGIKRMGELLQ
ncbi:MAG: aminotransferase class I/II-fold pyridoxal phosphate-dependent enzyme [Thaumarchaeota archaeon]|nr:aminotransferase class I/II-fold pyridoxal phosphate-dependent enzyme [Nitrososphaerota archaeon]